MEEKPPDTDLDLAAELRRREQRHSNWQSKDFNKAQVVLWAGVLASLAAALQAAGALSSFRPARLSPDIARSLAAFIAAVPAAAILIDKTFKWAARSAWHALYAIRLRGFIRSIRDRGAAPQDVSKALDDLELEMHNLFPPLDAAVLGTKPRG